MTPQAGRSAPILGSRRAALKALSLENTISKPRLAVKRAGRYRRKHTLTSCGRGLGARLDLGLASWSGAAERARVIGLKARDKAAMTTNGI